MLSGKSALSRCRQQWPQGGALPTDQDPAGETQPLLSCGSGEPGLPFGWLWVFVALMEIKDTQNNNEIKEEKKGGEN